MDFIFDPSLVLYLPLYQLDGASFMSRDKSGHLCTVTGALWTPDGRDFDGLDDKIAIPDASSLKVNGDGTWEMWIYRTIYGTECLIDKGSGYYEYEIRIDTPNNGEIRFGAGNGTSERIDFTSAAIPLDNWVHIVFVRTASPKQVKLYKNGSLVQTLSYTKTISQWTDPVYIGSRTGGSEFLDGIVGEVRIYSRALTSQEVQNNYLSLIHI